MRSFIVINRSVVLANFVAIAMLCSAPTALAMSPDEARHLLHRTGFGVSQTQWQGIIDRDYEDAVDWLVDQAGRHEAAAPPDWVDDTPLWTVVQRGWTAEKRRELRLKKRARMTELRAWWINQMLATPTPLQERMTLFWSNHFATQFSKIHAPMLMYRQHALFRNHALGRFDEMLFDVLKDPAMLLYLDNDKNNANSVNENLARELMELFTLGEGHYSEDDVKEAARCLTGWGVERRTGEFRIASKRHDKRTKRVLGTSGKFDGDDLARLLLNQAPTAERIVRKLWLEFISLEPDEAVIKRWAKAFHDNDFAIDALLKTMLKSRQFRSAENRGVLIKSPVELYVGMMRPALDGLTFEQISDEVSDLKAGKRLPRLLQLSGQNLFDPPTVEGWPGGLEWIDSQTLLAREQTVRNLVMQLNTARRAEQPYLADLNSDHESRQSVLANLNAIDPVTGIPQSYTQLQLLYELIRDPSVHVK